jgi:hypothetical protein
MVENIIKIHISVYENGAEKAIILCNKFTQKGRTGKKEEN